MHKAIEIAQVFLRLSHPECGDIISNLKLQRLLYYAQGFHLAIYGTPLFEDLVEAWNYGPVVPSVYQIYRGHGTGALPVDNSTEVHCSISEDQLAIIEEVYDVYGQYSGLKLMHLTQHEEPWKSTPTGRGNVIDTAKMEQFFRTRL
ncbi:MAG: DUF4065 domain-containing protein [Tannerellaceae bacterium]|jgi:uncharacterized phage-associated protein|nr:DUF4065 domain-containing protein [Tannerellaceae bacterium]